MVRRARAHPSLTFALAAWAVCTQPACTGSNPAFRTLDNPRDADIIRTDAAPASELAAPDVAPPSVSRPDLAPDQMPPVEATPPPPDLGTPPADAAPADNRPEASPPDAVPEVAAKPPLCPADDQLALCLGFDGTPTDESPQHLVFKPTKLGYGASPAGQAGDFTSATRLEGPATNTLEAPTFTIEATFKARTLPTGNARAGLLDYTREFGLFVHPSGSVVCSLVSDNGPDELMVSKLVTAGVWTTIACVASTTTVAVWKDGVMKASQPINPPKPGTGDNIPVIGGNYATNSPDPFDGLIDDVRVWKRVRTAVELCSFAPACVP